MPVELSDSIKYILGNLLLKKQTSSSHDSIPKILIIVPFEVANHAIGRITAGVSKKIVIVVLGDLCFDQFFVFSKLFLKISLFHSLRRVFSSRHFFVFIVVIVIQVIFIELLVTLDFLGSWAMLELTEAIINDFDLNAKKSTS